MRNVRHRLDRLEQARPTDAPTPRYFVVRDEDPLPADIREHDLVIWLPRKAESAEAWERQCRDRFDSGRLPRDAEKGDTP